MALRFGFRREDPLTDVPRLVAIEPAVMSPALLATVMASLSAHPHDDTADRIRTRLGDEIVSDADIRATLRELHERALVVTAGGHWQLTTTGYREVRARVPVR